MKIVIMAGGSGKRFWPKSRALFPKQCIPITSSKEMIVETVERLETLVGKKDMYIATGNSIYNKIEQLLPDVNYIVEPVPRNTAACIGLSAITISDKDEIMIIETADHTYLDVKAYIENLKAAVEMAKQDKIVLIGIKPTFPHTGLGYIKTGKSIKEEKIVISKIDDFKEKPDSLTASKFLESGNFLWNAGIFVTKVKTILEAIKKHLPKMYDSLIKIKESNFDKKVLEKEFSSIASISIDYGVLEKSDNLAVVEGNFHWDDVGDWGAIERIKKKDLDGNIISGSYEGTATDSIIMGNNKKIIANNIKNTIIVDSEDCLLICKKDRAQDVKKIVSILEKNPGLKRFAEDIQEKSIPEVIQIDCKNIDIKSTSLVACIGLRDITIEKEEIVQINGI